MPRAANFRETKLAQVRLATRAQSLNTPNNSEERRPIALVGEPADSLDAVDRIRQLEARLENQVELTRVERSRADQAEAKLFALKSTERRSIGPSKEFAEAAVNAAKGGVVRIFLRADSSWEIHNPLLVDLETAAAHLGCSVRTIKRKAATHGIGISHEVGPRINLQALVASIAATAA